MLANVIQYGIIIDAYGTFEYTSGGYTFQFVEDGIIVVSDCAKCLPVAKILCRDI
jgi:hypothetical protein